MNKELKAGNLKTYEQIVEDKKSLIGQLSDLTKKLSKLKAIEESRNTAWEKNAKLQERLDRANGELRELRKKFDYQREVLVLHYKSITLLTNERDELKIESLNQQIIINNMTFITENKTAESLISANKKLIKERDELLKEDT